MSEQHAHPVTPTRLVFQLLGPVVFLLVFFGFHPVPDKPAVGATLAVALWMAIYWFSDAIPMAATALIPVVVFPFLGVLKASQVASLYLNDVIMLFVGGFLIAAAMERWELHRRIALRIILVLGHSPARLLLGFMCAGWLLSQWISNTATTLMMVPIVIAIVAGFEERIGDAARPLTVCLLIGIAYASSIGGIATLIGTPPNLALAEIFRLTFDAAPPITFLRWLLFGLPVSALLFVIAFLYLRLAVLRGLRLPLDRVVLEREHAALGHIRVEERAVLAVFAAFALLLLTRADIVLGGTTLHGWASRLGVASAVGDGTVAIGVALILFLIPARSRRGCLLDTGAVRGLPWDIVVLFGGGFALARAFQASGLSEYLGGRLIALGSLPPVVLVIAICTLLTFLTELTSNTATTQVVLPIIASMCVALEIDPLLLMVPATVSASCAFMLPVATPPNAIVFGTYRLRIADMARTGIVLNVIGIVVVTALMMTLGRWVFGIDLQVPPAWIHATGP